MAGMLGQLGSQGAAGLSQANIDKLKASEREAKVKPLETSLSKWEEERTALGAIKSKVNEFLDAAKAFDLYSKENAFEQMSAQTEGSSATFKSIDGATVDPGNIDVFIKQLATRDVYQSSQIPDMNAMIHAETTPPTPPPEPTKPKEPANYSTYGFIDDSVEYKQYQDELAAYEAAVESYDARIEEYNQQMLEYNNFMAEKQLEFQTDPGVEPKLIIDTAGKAYEFKTYGKTYQELFDEMRAIDDIDVSLAKVTTDTSRIAIKSGESGTENALKITQNNVFLGLGPNDANAHVVEAQDMVANIDGIDYQYPTNTIEIKEGLMMTAVSAGKSSIHIERDDGTIMPAINNFVDKYNALVDELNTATIDPNSPINDRSNLRMIQSQVKSILMQGYGKNGENNLFVNGFGFDKQGKLSVDQTKLSSEITNNYGLIKEMFVGNSINMTQGMGTRMSEYLDSLDGYNGGLSLYESNLNHRKEVLEKEKEDAIEDLDRKYQDLANKYAAYSDVINKMETSFKGFQNMIRGG